MNKKNIFFNMLTYLIKTKALCSLIDIFVCKCWLWECYLCDVSVLTYVPFSNLGQAADWRQGLLEICRDYRGLREMKHIPGLTEQPMSACLTAIYPV